MVNKLNALFLFFLLCLNASTIPLSQIEKDCNWLESKAGQELLKKKKNKNVKDVNIFLVCGESCAVV